MNAPCQRWRSRRSIYRPAGEPIDTRRYGVEVVPFAQARDFVVEHHYAGSMPAARLSVGLYHVQRLQPLLVGVAVFSVPMQQRVIPARLGLAPEHGIELGRLVLLDEVPANGESWFCAQAFELVVQELGVHGVLAYSDPVERRTADGELLKPGHQGIVYRALNMRYVGRSKRRRLTLAPNGEVISDRTLSKLRNGERGAAYAYQQLLTWGAPKRLPLESGHDYVVRALREGPFTSLRHPGNLAYVLALGDRRQRRRVEVGMPSALPFPGIASSTAVTPQARSGAGGEHVAS